MEAAGSVVCASPLNGTCNWIGRESTALGTLDCPRKKDPTVVVIVVFSLWWSFALAVLHPPTPFPYRCACTSIQCFLVKWTMSKKNIHTLFFCSFPPIFFCFSHLNTVGLYPWRARATPPPVRYLNPLFFFCIEYSKNRGKGRRGGRDFVLCLLQLCWRVRLFVRWRHQKPSQLQKQANKKEENARYGVHLHGNACI